MSSGEENELQELVKQILEKSGTLSRLRADLRANVFLALEQNGSFQDEKFGNEKLKRLIESKEGVITLSLVKEFLDYYGLMFTSSVFTPETSIDPNCNYIDRFALLEEFNISPVKNLEGPVLLSIVQSAGEHVKKSNPNTSNDNLGVLDYEERSFSNKSDLFSVHVTPKSYNRQSMWVANNKNEKRNVIDDSHASDFPPISRNISIDTIYYNKTNKNVTEKLKSLLVTDKDEPLQSSADEYRGNDEEGDNSMSDVEEISSICNQAVNSPDSCSSPIAENEVGKKESSLTLKPIIRNLLDTTY